MRASYNDNSGSWKAPLHAPNSRTACSEYVSGTSFHPFKRNEKCTVLNSLARSPALIPRERNSRILATKSKTSMRASKPEDRSGKPVPPTRCRSASCISVVVFPRPAGASTTIRRLSRRASWKVASSSKSPVSFCFHLVWTPAVNPWLSGQTRNGKPSLNGFRYCLARLSDQVGNGGFNGYLNAQVAPAD